MNDLDLKLSAYADGELDQTTVPELERIIATDPAAWQTVEMHRASTALLRAACAESVYGVPAIVLSQPMPRVSIGRRPFAWAAAAAVVFGVVGGGAAWSGVFKSHRDHLVDEVAEYHEVFSRETQHLTEVFADQGDHIKAWLGQRVGKPFEIPDLSASNLTFAGARMLVIDGKPVADLFYTRAEGLPIALCMMTLAGSALPMQDDARGALNVVSWSDGTLGYVLVGEMERTRLRGISSQIARQMPG